jgi:hypothetical protein
MTKRTTRRPKGAASPEHSLHRSIHAALTEAGEPLEAAAAEPKSVVFTCDNPLCIVGLKIVGVPPLTFSGQQGISLLPGQRAMAWKVVSSPSGEAFHVTVTGATLDQPIAGTTGANSGGVRQLTV